ncbi:putative CtpA-like serine protease [Calidithermus terrae]|uniref:Putative CtpA-like serine protease n=1 Tax=Calidithermus terrae TaxID=1408545 RepID=A0A399EL59_9DEIN|nr:S41 family peptidase [Calidithermus terrae]RIH83819.1 putative CtpA-like serine protease [Calidithermus terrae]
MARALRRLAGLWGLLLLGLAQASPAEDLFDQASYYLTQRYIRADPAALAPLLSQYQSKLKEVCAPAPDACGFEAAGRLIAALVEELGDGHTHYFPPLDYGVLAEELAGGAQPTYGLETLRVPQTREHWVLRVDPGGPAEKAGLQRGDRVVLANRQPLPESAREAYRLLESPKSAGLSLELTLSRAGRRWAVVLKSVLGEGSPLPSLTTRPDGVGVLSIPNFDAAGAVGPKVHELVALAGERGVKKLVVDLRDNPGGLVTEFLASAGAFFDSLSRRFRSRDGDFEQGYRRGQVYGKAAGDEEAYVFYTLRKPARWRGPLAVLVNSRSASGAEYFAADVQLRRRGAVVGERTSGVGNTSTRFVQLMDGSGLQISSSLALQPDGSPYPEAVTPDLIVPDDLEARNRGQDLPLARALEWLAAQP